MKLYSSLFADLNESQPVSEETVFKASDRPIIVLEAEEELSEQSFFNSSGC